MLAQQVEIIKLAIAWALVGGLIFTLIATCLSLVGFLEFKDKSQQQKLFIGLLLEVVSISVTSFGNLLNYDPKATADDILSLGNFQYWSSFKQKGVESIQKPRQFPCEYLYAYSDSTASVDGTIKYFSRENVYVETNHRVLKSGESFPTYYYYFRPVRSDDSSIYVYDDQRAMALQLPLRSGRAKLSGDGDKASNYTDWHDLVVTSPGG